MPGPAPAKVQHLVVQVAAKTGEELTPVWDADTGTWTISVGNPAECSEMLHHWLFHETGADYTDCPGGHRVAATFTFRRSGYKYGVPVWKMHTVVQVDDCKERKISPSLIMQFLAKPTKPLGDGKVSHASDGSNKQTMNVKKTTVIRV